MPLVGETTIRAIHNADGLVGANYEVNMAPSNVCAKVALNVYNEYTRASGDTPPYDSQRPSIDIKNEKEKDRMVSLNGTM